MSKLYSNTTADFLDWSEMTNLVRGLYDKGNYKMSLLVALGCFTGLRISDLLTLTWEQLRVSDTIELVEKKTGKKRIIRLNVQLQRHIKACHEKIKPEGDNLPCFLSQLGTVYSVQRINIILKGLKADHNLHVNNFSTHSLRKTFGRKVYEQAGTQSEFALIKLSEIFNHSSPAITKRYLGIKQEELLQTYDCLTF